MGEAMVRSVLEVILQIVDMQISIGETLARCKVEVTSNLVYTNRTFEPAAFLALSFQSFSIVFPVTLLDILATTKGP